MTASLRQRGAGHPAPRDPAARHRFVTGDGTPLYVHEDGDCAAAVTVVLVHGWTQDHTTWNRVAGALPGRCARPVRILRYDHRGHGGSAPAPAGTATIDRVADDLAELLDERVPAGPVVLAGHSMGGATIMALAARHPELLPRLAGVGFVATTAGGLSELTFGLPRVLAARVVAAEPAMSSRVSRSRRVAVLRRTAVLRPVVRRLTFGTVADPVEVISTAAQIGRCHPASAVGFLDSLLAHERSAELAALREVPCVILSGDRDRLCPRAHSRAIAGELPHAEFVPCPGAGHMLPAERPGEVAARLATLADAA